MPSTSLIVSTYNWPEALNLCLISIKKQTVLPLEVIIADDGSNKETEKLIQQFQSNFPVPLIHIWHEDRGFRKTIVLNKAIKTAKGEYIVQVDGDVILEKHFLTDHISLAQKKTFIRGTRAHITENMLPMVYKNEKIDFTFRSKGMINRFNALRIPILAFLFQKKQNNSNSVRGSNLAYWKSDFILINGYNNDLNGWGHEDEELAARFINNNIMKVAVKFKAIQFHLFHQLASRSQETVHSDTVKRTIQQRLKTCNNGYSQTEL